MEVLIIDYGMGNLHSVKRAFEECGALAYISDNPGDLGTATHVVLPGVGAFPDGMKNLKGMGWVPAIEEAVSEGVPLLGICLGMQLLAEKGYEVEETRGLGLIKGEVNRLVPDSADVRIPHIGWNEIYKHRNSLLFDNISDGSDFYFVHSYHFVPAEAEDIAATTPYCGSFVSAVANNKVFGVQFHPEKSHKTGFSLIKNFLNIL